MLTDDLTWQPGYLREIRGFPNDPASRRVRLYLVGVFFVLIFERLSNTI